MVLLSVRKAALLLAVAVFLIAGAALAADEVFPPLSNWTAPATFSSHGASRGASTMGDISQPIPFVATTPCRQYDSRNFTPLLQNTSRAVTLTGAPCGLPGSAAAVSVNITIFNISGATGNGVFQVGTATAPTFAWINFPPTETQRGNAGALPLDGAGQIWVRVLMGGGQLDFTVDVNGYYPDANRGDITPGEAFQITGSSSGIGILFARNESSSGASTSGVRGQVSGTGTDAAGVLGESLAATGLGRGVLGRTTSLTNHGSAIFGRDSTGVVSTTAGPATSPAGVAGHGQNGLIGKTSSVNGFAVTGVAENGSGVATGAGIVGLGTHAFVASIGDYAGPSPSITIDAHPTDASAVIGYISLTGNEAGTYFRGTAQTAGREFVIDVPEDFRMVTDPEGLTVQLTPVGAPATMYVVSEDMNQIVVHSSKDVRFHYLVQGIRLGYTGYNPMQKSMDYAIFLPQTPDGKMQSAWPEYIKQRLIANGTYNPDGTINMQTAERVGWAKIWREREEAAKAAAAKAAAEWSSKN